MACVNCYYFDSSYHGGYCDKKGEDCSPSGNCSDFWDDSSKSSGSHTCENCYYFDSGYHGGYCDRDKMDVYPSSSCMYFTE